MKINLAVWDRVLRFVIGILLASWALAGGPWWGWVGLYLVVSAAWGICPVYAIFKIRTAVRSSHQQHLPPE